jgi:hypothetical protein
MTIRTLVCSVLAVAALALTATPAAAQYYNPHYNPYGYGTAGPYPGRYFSYDAGSVLTGRSDIINASGNFLVKQQEANKAAALAQSQWQDTRRKTYEQSTWELKYAPTNEDYRMRMQDEQLRRAMNNPPYAEVTSGVALNSLLLYLPDPASSVHVGQTARLDQELLKQINVTQGTRDQLQLGGIRDLDNVSWPDSLKGARQKRLDTLFKQATAELQKAGRVGQALISQINKETTGIEKDLDGMIDTLDPDIWMQTRGFVLDLKRTVRVLSQPNAGDYFGGRFSVRGETVPDVIVYMKSNGLRFAPSRGIAAEPAYAYLHREMANYGTQAAVAQSEFRVRVQPAIRKSEP